MIGKILIGLGVLVVLVVLVVVVLLLSGYVQIFPVRPVGRNWRPYYYRTKDVSAQTQWASQGRGTFRHAGGGSGRMTWKQDGEVLVIELMVPKTRQHLHVRAVLGESLCVDGLEQGRIYGEDASRQLTALFGEPLPLDQLSFWLRGVSAPFGSGGGPTYIANSGRTKTDSQAGWLITYKRWHPATDTRPDLPRRLVITKGDARLRFVIDNWSWGARE